MPKISRSRKNARRQLAGLPPVLPRHEPGTLMPFDTEKFILETMAALKDNPDFLDERPDGDVTRQELDAYFPPRAVCGCGVSGPLHKADRRCAMDPGFKDGGVLWLWVCPGCSQPLIEGRDYHLPPKYFPASGSAAAADEAFPATTSVDAQAGEAAAH